MRPAVFLDRDGTIIQHVHHLNRVDDVALIPGVGAALRKLSEAGYANVVVTNQSVVARGLLDIPGLERIHERLTELLEAEGAKLDGIYYCTTMPGTSDQTAIEDRNRKPGPGMLEQAARDLDLDLAASYMIGDSLSDLWAGKNAGCRESLLVLTGYGQATLGKEPNAWRSAPTIVEASAMILEATKRN